MKWPPTPAPDSTGPASGRNPRHPSGLSSSITTSRDAQLSGDLRVKSDMEVAAALKQDAQLMLRVREGDHSSFALLLGQHRRPVVHFLYRMVQNQAVSEELAQEVFLRVYRSRATYEPTAKFRTWL